MLELEVGFRKLKEKMDQLNLDYRVFLFEIDLTGEQLSQAEDIDQDSEDVKLLLAN